jgi:DNA polymerase
VANVQAGDAIEILMLELRRLRSEGVESVPVGPEAETALRELLARARGRPAPAGPEAAAGSPVAPMGVEGKPAESSPVQAKVAVPARKAPSQAEAMPPPPEVEVPSTGTREERWAALRAALEACPEARRRRPAGSPAHVGHGSTQPDILFVGEHPDEHEEGSGDPMSGPAGALMGKAIRAMGLSLDRVHLAPVIRWRPLLPSRLGTRPPSAAEIAYCLPYLRAQVQVLAPRVVVAMGNVPLNALAGAGQPLRITQERGVWREALGVPLLPTYLPSYLLRNPSSKVKREFWEDLLAVMERLGLPISERQRGFYR